MPLDFPSSPVNGQVYDNFVYDVATGSWLGAQQKTGLSTTVASIDSRATSLESRATNSEYAASVTNRTGLVSVIPTSVSASTGTISYNTTTGIITLSSASDFQIRGIFTTTYDSYFLKMSLTAGTPNPLFGKFLVGTTPYSGAQYGYTCFYVQGAGTGVNNNNNGTANHFEMAYAHNLTMEINGPMQSDRNTDCCYDTSYNHTRFMGQMGYENTGTFDGINFYNNTYTGTVQVYGFRKS